MLASLPDDRTISLPAHSGSLDLWCECDAHYSSYVIETKKKNEEELYMQGGQYFQ